MVSLALNLLIEKIRYEIHIPTNLFRIQIGLFI